MAIKTDELREQISSILFDGKSAISLEAHERETLSEIMDIIKEHIDYVIGEDEQPVEVDGFYFTADEVNKSVKIVNNRLAEQRRKQAEAQ